MVFFKDSNKVDEKNFNSVLELELYQKSAVQVVKIKELKAHFSTAGKVLTTPHTLRNVEV